MGDRQVVLEIEIDRPPERVFQALIEPDEVLQWWGSPDIYMVTAFALEPVEGGQWRLSATGFKGERFDVAGKILRYEPNRLLSFTWNPSWQPMPETTVEFALTPIPSGTRVQFRHTGFSRDLPGYETHLYGWPLVLNWLAGKA